MPERALRRFFLAAPHRAEAPRLLANEASHAARVLRLGPGDRVLGLDGRGGTWPLVLTAVRRDEVTVEPDGEPELEPEPGQPGAPLPWIEVAVAWPKRPRVPAMLERLTQLGAAAIRPLLCQNTGPAPPTPKDLERAERALREASKQSRRAWLPQLAPPADLAELLEREPACPAAHLDPAGPVSFDTWARSLAGTPEGRTTRERPTLICVGPEGGFDAGEREALLERDATATTLGPHVLRIETAAEAAMAVIAALWSVHYQPPRRRIDT